MTRAELHQLVDQLPEDMLPGVAQLLQAARDLQDPVIAALDAAPYDDEPVTEEEERELQAAREEVARGEVISLEEAFPD